MKKTILFSLNKVKVAFHLIYFLRKNEYHTNLNFLLHITYFEIKHT